MAIFREVETTVYCDVCGEYVIGWHSKGQGVSRVCGSYLYAQGSSGLLRGTEATPPVAFNIPRIYQMPEE